MRVIRRQASDNVMANGRGKTPVQTGAARSQVPALRLGRVIRDIRRKIAWNERLEKRFANLPALAVLVRFR
jgi:hypothetical protein